MTYYELLGVTEQATADEIKRAYRKLASQHHPDKGGDKVKFQEIQSAYDTLSDPGKRQQYDMQRSGQMPGGFRFTVNGQDMSGMGGGVEEMLRNFGFNFGGFPGGDPFGHVRQPRRNKDLRIDIPITLASTLEEQSKTISVQTTNGHRETVEVKIPRGVSNGTQIKYAGIGDNFFNTLPRGDLYVHFTILPHPPFFVDGLDIIVEKTVDCLTAITGGEIEVSGIDDKKFLLSVPPGAQPGSAFRLTGQGVWQLHGLQRGNLIVKLAITIPQNLSDKQIELINQIKNTQ